MAKVEQRQAATVVHDRNAPRHFNFKTLHSEYNENGETTQTQLLLVIAFFLLGISPNLSFRLSKGLSSLECKKLKAKKWNIED